MEQYSNWWDHAPDRQKLPIYVHFCLQWWPGLPKRSKQCDWVSHFSPLKIRWNLLIPSYFRQSINVHDNSSWTVNDKTINIISFIFIITIKIIFRIIRTVIIRIMIWIMVLLMIKKSSLKGINTNCSRGRVDWANVESFALVNLHCDVNGSETLLAMTNASQKHYRKTKFCTHSRFYLYSQKLGA